MTESASASASAVSASASLASGIISQAAAASASAQAVLDELSGHVAKSTTSKIIGVVLAVSSGLLIGSSFVFKKKGLLSSQKSLETAGEGHAYLKSPMWWTGMIIMVVGEICNFVAYAFADAVLVTPLGALSVVVCAILSSIFLKERLSFFGKIGCALCINGAAIIALNSPAEQSVTTIAEFQKLFLAPGFLVFGSVCIVGSIAIVFFVAPKYGKKNMLVYISVCSLIGGLSVANTQALGAAIVTSIGGNSQIKEWFFWFLLVFVIITLLIEINYLNKALELFNTAMVTPTYYVLFTFCTLVTSVILYQGLKAPVLDIITLVLGFLTICAGITLLQMSKIDPKELKLDRRTTILLSAAKADTETSEKGSHPGLDIEDPGIDALRGTAGAIGSIYRARSARRSMQSHKSGGSEWRRRQNRGNTLSTVGLDNIARHTLYDRPVSDQPLPDDAVEQISLHSAGSPQGKLPTYAPPPPNRAVSDSSNRPRAPTLHFSDDITSHHYPAVGQTGVATHEHYSDPKHDGHLHSPTAPSIRGLNSASSEEKKWSAYTESFIEPYTRGFTSPQPHHGEALQSPSLNAALKASFSAPRLELDLSHTRSTRSKNRDRAHSGTSAVGAFGQLFSPRHKVEHGEESASLVRSPDGLERQTLPSNVDYSDEEDVESKEGSVEGDAV